MSTKQRPVAGGIFFIGVGLLTIVGAAFFTLTTPLSDSAQGWLPGPTWFWGPVTVICGAVGVILGVVLLARHRQDRR